VWLPRRWGHEFRRNLQVVIPAKAGIHEPRRNFQVVIPAKAGIHESRRNFRAVIPVKARIHESHSNSRAVIPAKAGIHEPRRNFQVVIPASAGIQGLSRERVGHVDVALIVMPHAYDVIQRGAYLRDFIRFRAKGAGFPRSRE